MKFNADKNKVMVLGGKKGLECDIRVHGGTIEQVSELKYLECVFNESGTGDDECCMKVASGRKVVGPIRHLVNA